MCHGHSRFEHMNHQICDVLISLDLISYFILTLTHILYNKYLSVSDHFNQLKASFYFCHPSYFKKLHTHFHTALGGSVEVVWYISPSGCLARWPVVTSLQLRLKAPRKWKWMRVGFLLEACRQLLRRNFLWLHIGIYKWFIVTKGHSNEPVNSISR